MYFTEGTVKITKHGTRYCIEADLTAEDDTKFKFKYHPEEDFKTNDATFLSELTENVVSEIDSIEFKYYGNYESPNTGTWTGYMIADGLELNDNGTLAQGAVGKTLNFQFYTDGKKFLEDGITPDPSGRYTFDMSLDAWTAEDGTVKDGGLNGSWLYDFNDGAMKHAPMRGGFLEIERAEDGTFTVALETSDGKSRVACTNTISANIN